MKTKHRVAAGSAALLGALALAGCSGAAASPTPTVTVTATATVSATPTPTVAARSFDDPITEFDAWSLCWGAATAGYGPDWTIQPYSAEAPLAGKTLVDNGDGTFTVTVIWFPASGEGFAGEAGCKAGGTLGDPTVELTGDIRDYG